MLFVVFTIVAYLILYCYSYIFGRPHPKFPPGPLRWPIWGGYLQLLLENYRFPHQALHWMARRYNTEVIGLYLGAYPTVIACSQASVRDALNKPEFQGRVEGFIPSQRDPDGVIRGQFFVDGHRWFEQRRFMLRNLREFGLGTRNKQFETIIEEELKDFIDLVQSKHVKGVCYDGKVVVPPAFYAFFTNLTLQIVLGTRLPPDQHHKLREYAYAAYNFQLCTDPTTGAINLTPWVRHFTPGGFGYKDLMKNNALMKDFIKALVQEHKDTFLPDALRDYCDIYLKEMNKKQNSETQHWFEEEQLVMTFWDVLFPSAMGQSATIGFAVQFLLHHPKVQIRVQQEIDNVVGHSRLPNLNDRKNLPYTEAVLREVMRRETVTAMAIPHRCTEDTEFYGHVVPKIIAYSPDLTPSDYHMFLRLKKQLGGECYDDDKVKTAKLEWLSRKDTMVMVNLWSSHMDERVWENPFEFNPDRHLDEDKKLKKKDFTVPFGAGKHVCSGETYSRQNMFLLFSTILQHFSLELPEGQALPDMNDHLSGINVSPRWFPIKLVPR